MNARLARYLVISISLCGASLQAAAQEPTRPDTQQSTQAVEQQQPLARYRFRVLGTYDARTGDPISDVKVSDMASGTSALTTSTGTVSLIFLPDGGSLVRVQKIGYEPQTMPVTISSDDTVPLTVIMKRMTVLPTIVTTAGAPIVSPALRGFKEREAIGLGYFLDDTILRKSEGQPLANVLRRLPSINIYDGPHSATYLLKSPRCMAGAPPQVFLDGTPVPGADPPPGSSATAATTPADLHNFSPSDLAGVEWYPSTEDAPLQFGGTSQRCGVLLLWTRER